MTQELHHLVDDLMKNLADQNLAGAKLRRVEIIRRVDAAVAALEYEKARPYEPNLADLAARQNVQYGRPEDLPLIQQKAVNVYLPYSHQHMGVQVEQTVPSAPEPLRERMARRWRRLLRTG